MSGTKTEVYIAQHPGFSYDGLPFVNGVLQTSDPEQIAKMEEGLKLPHVRSLVQKMDQEKARQVAASRMEDIRRQHAAKAGAFSSDALKAMQPVGETALQNLDQRDANLDAQGVTATVVEQENQVGLTHREAPASVPDDGFIPNKPNTSPEVKSSAEPEAPKLAREAKAETAPAKPAKASKVALKPKE